MILAKDEAGRRIALAKILPYQEADFEGIFAAMEGCPVTVRLLDPPCMSLFLTMKKVNRKWRKPWEFRSK